MRILFCLEFVLIPLDFDLGCRCHFFLFVQVTFHRCHFGTLNNNIHYAQHCSQRYFSTTCSQKQCKISSMHNQIIQKFLRLLYFITFCKACTNKCYLCVCVVCMHFRYQIFYYMYLRLLLLLLLLLWWLHNVHTPSTRLLLMGSI